jgi:hypothetical protein
MLEVDVNIGTMLASLAWITATPTVVHMGVHLGCVWYGVVLCRP